MENHTTPTSFKIELAAPGLNKEDFKIELKKDNLSVWAEKKVAQTEEQEDYTRREFQYSSFARSFVLPEDIDAEKINAEYEALKPIFELKLFIVRKLIAIFRWHNYSTNFLLI